MQLLPVKASQAACCASSRSLHMLVSTVLMLERLSFDNVRMLCGP